MTPAKRCDRRHRAGDLVRFASLRRDWDLGGRAHMNGTQTVTVLVTDLVGSTELRVALGEDGAEELRRRHDALLGQAVTGHQGTLVKGLGDGVLALFPSAADAIAAAVEMQPSVDTQWARSGPPVAIRGGGRDGNVTREHCSCC